MELYVLLAELDGTGVPMAYFFIEKVPLNEKFTKQNYNTSPGLLFETATISGTRSFLYRLQKGLVGDKCSTAGLAVGESSTLLLACKKRHINEDERLIQGRFPGLLHAW